MGISQLYNKLYCMCNGTGSSYIAQNPFLTSVQSTLHVTPFQLHTFLTTPKIVYTVHYCVDIVTCVHIYSAFINMINN